MTVFIFLVEQIAIPVVPTVRVVITFTKFVELQPIEEFYTPMSSPAQFGSGRISGDEMGSGLATVSSRSWFSLNAYKSGSASKHHWEQPEQANPFAIPSGYTWSSFDDKSRKMKKSKSTRKPK